jgi:hypothetical protein
MRRAGISRNLIITLLAIIAFGFVVVRRAYPFDRCGERGASACPAPSHDAAVGTEVAATEFCPYAGYLCAGGGLGAGNFVLRWSLFKGVLRVRVPLPEEFSGDEARAIRAAGIAGVLQWNGHPFRIDIDSASVPTRWWDINLVWTGSLAGIGANVGGVTHWEASSANAADFRAKNIGVITREAWNGGSGATLPAESITTIAAHEMGHALGLPHSDQTTDVMYPSAIRGTNVSERDLASVDWLYWLPAGAKIR